MSNCVALLRAITYTERGKKKFSCVLGTYPLKYNIISLKVTSIIRLREDQQLNNKEKPLEVA